MKRIVLIRHGEYGADDHLDERGRQQMHDLEKLLEPLAASWGRIGFLSSEADRAFESAVQLASGFRCWVEPVELLWSESSHPENLPALLELLNEGADEVDTYVLVTHYEYVSFFPGFFARQEWSRELDANERQQVRLAVKGSALILDCIKQRVELIDPVLSAL